MLDRLFQRGGSSSATPAAGPPVAVMPDAPSEVISSDRPLTIIVDGGAPNIAARRPDSMCTAAADDTSSSPSPPASPVQVSAASPASAPPLKSGWLTKQGGSGLAKNWRRRWFVLQPPFLHYFKAPHDTRPAGSIDLEAFTHIEEECSGTVCRGANKFCWKLSARPTIVAVVPVVVTPSTADNSNTEPCAERVDEKDNDDKTVIAPSSPPPSPTVTRPPIVEVPLSPTERGITHRERIYYAFADSEQDLHEWLNAIRPHLSGSRDDPANESTADTSATENVGDNIERALHSEESKVPGETVQTDALCVPMRAASLSAASLGVPPPSPPQELAPISAVTDVKDSMDGKGAIPGDSTSNDEDIKAPMPTTTTTASVPGHKISSLPAKMAELAAMMGRLEQGKLGGADELAVLHDMLRMCYAMLCKEQSALVESQ